MMTIDGEILENLDNALVELMEDLGIEEDKFAVMLMILAKEKCDECNIDFQGISNTEDLQ